MPNNGGSKKEKIIGIYKTQSVIRRPVPLLHLPWLIFLGYIRRSMEVRLTHSLGRPKAGNH